MIVVNIQFTKLQLKKDKFESLILSLKFIIREMYQQLLT